MNSRRRRRPGPHNPGVTPQPSHLGQPPTSGRTLSRDRGRDSHAGTRRPGRRLLGSARCGGDGGRHRSGGGRAGEGRCSRGSRRLPRPPLSKGADRRCRRFPELRAPTWGAISATPPGPRPGLLPFCAPREQVVMEPRAVILVFGAERS
nr:uncharacterized protein LOC116286122 [Vicugna pacos]